MQEGALTRLGSGMRINRAADDAAGLAVVTTLDVQRRVASQAIRNVSDAISLLNIASGSLSELSSIVSRQKELAEQAANGVYSQAQRSALSAEQAALSKEYNRVLSTTTFNNISLLSQPTTISVEVGAGTGGDIGLSLGTFIGRGVGDGSFTASALPINNQNGSQGVDVNRDGLLDLLSVGSNRMSVMLGNGDGTFRSSSVYDTGQFPLSLAVKDINGDGNVDAVTSNYVSNSITVLIGNSDGSFKAAVSLPAGVHPTSLTLADMDGDGRQDILSVFDLDQVVGLYTGNGDGTFKAPIIFGPHGYGYDSAVGDFNNDNRLDFVMGIGGGTNNVLYFGTGGTTFTGPSSVASSSGTTEVSVGDVNGDGILDLANGSSSGTTVSIRLGNGDGSFKVERVISTGAVDNLELKDINEDGRADIITVDDGQGRVSVALGNGDGSFRVATSFSAPSPNGTLGFGDFNGDGGLDIVTGSRILIAGLQKVTSIDSIDISSAEGSRNALATLTKVQDRISMEQGSLGAFQSRLEIACRNLQVAREANAAASSRIADADVAAESAELLRANILLQTGASIAAQANRSSDIVLNLLRQ